MSNGGKVLIGVLAGAAAGVVTGVLIAPASGKETRETITDKSEELLEGVRELINKEKEKVGGKSSSKTGE
ncbi:MAG: YtxH domain-containing protein [Bacteroidales bacterium]|nr:YtxH domain-containing protein [Bacteroidales bacterium]MCF8336800.1 YtxH domain-containing protein [Bacteroidales bacterium]